VPQIESDLTALCKQHVATDPGVIGDAFSQAGVSLPVYRAARFVMVRVVQYISRVLESDPESDLSTTLAPQVQLLDKLVQDFGMDPNSVELVVEKLSSLSPRVDALMCHVFIHQGNRLPPAIARSCLEHLASRPKASAGDPRATLTPARLEQAKLCMKRQWKEAEAPMARQPLVNEAADAPPHRGTVNKKVRALAYELLDDFKQTEYRGGLMTSHERRVLQNIKHADGPTFREECRTNPFWTNEGGHSDKAAREIQKIRMRLEAAQAAATAVSRPE
jgi:hypothetical protein